MNVTEVDVESGWTSPAETAALAETGEHTLVFRPLGPQDRQVVQKYHEDWFPVKYDDEFYDELVQNRMVGTGQRLFTCCACVGEDGSTEEELAACVVGAFGRVARLSPEMQELLVSDSLRYRKVFYIMTLGSVRHWRQLGLASMLVEQCINVVERDPTCGVIYLHVVTFNTAAIRFYEKLGFFRVQEIKDYYIIEGDHYNCYLYAKYFHGNQGHNQFYKIMSRAFKIVWEKLKTPLSLLFGFEDVPMITAATLSASDDPTVPL